MLALRYPIGLGLTVAAGLAQIGEFSFILAGLGVSLKLLPKEGQDLILAGAILSITLNPLIFAAAERLKKTALIKWPIWCDRHGKMKHEKLERELAIIRVAGEERDKKHQQELKQLIETFPLFSQLDKTSREELFLLFRPKSASPGERVIRVGDRGDGMYFIVAGAVEVRLDSGDVPLNAGAFFGEMALLSGGRRTADVVAIDFCQFLVLDRRDFNIFASRYPGLRSAVTTMARERTEMNVSRQKADD